MTLIRKSLYKELVAVRSERLTKLEYIQNELKIIAEAIKVEQAFVDDFDKTQANLEASKKALDASVAEQKALVTKLKNEREVLEASVRDAKDVTKDSQAALREEQDKLANLKEEGASASDIAAQQIRVDSAESVVSANITKVEVLEAKIDTNTVAQEAAKTAIETNEKAVEETQKQIEDNNEKKKDSDEELENLKTNENELTTKQTELLVEYNKFLSENKETISLYEAQQLKRDQNITKENPTAAFYRAPINSSVIFEADEVMDGVIADELDATEDEKKSREEWIKAGADKSINPSYLSATQAKDLTLSAIWSTRKVAKQIQDACIAGEFETKVGALKNSVMYALQQAGYKLYLTESTNDKLASIVISWENIRGES